MKVFISWSGDTSRQFAAALSDWLPKVIQAVKPFYSRTDIDKGARWLNEISKELEQSSAGILCVTKENLEAAWIMFEAGALAKSLDKSRVMPLLFDIDASDLQGPLVQFQAVRFDESDVYKMLQSINKAQGDAALSDSVLKDAFDKGWSDLDSQVQLIQETSVSNAARPQRTERELIVEILKTVRFLAYKKPLLEDDFLWQSPSELGLNENIGKKLDSKYLFIGALVQDNESGLLEAGFTRKQLTEIKDRLATKGLSLGLKLDGWPICGQ